MEAEAWYVGCACDRRYVAHTATMLASIDINGKLPEARVLVAGFGLTEEDHKIIRAGAGSLARGMIIHEVADDHIKPIGATKWTAEYPPAVVGRLFLADLIREGGARLLTIDSDVIVNVSLRPLFQMDLFGSYVAACHDVPRQEDLNYFNSGIMLFDVDEYKRFNVAQRALDWLRNQNGRVLFPDQDALNHVVGHIWSRLDHRWNFHCNYGEQRAVTSNDYERSYIAHFAANKPWNDPTHPGRPLYQHYREELGRRLELEAKLADKSDAAYVATAFQVLLGRAPRDAEEFIAFAGLGAKETIVSIVKSREFLSDVLLPWIMREPWSSNIFPGVPEEVHRLWAEQRLNLSAHSVEEVKSARSWATLLAPILRDPSFRRWSSNVYLMALADLIRSHLEGRERVTTAQATEKRFNNSK